MSKFHSELRVPVEVDRRSFADRYRDRFESDWTSDLSSRGRTFSPKPTSYSLFDKSNPNSSTSTAGTGTGSSTSSTFIPWHRHFSNGSLSPLDFPDGHDWFEEMRRRFDERRRRWDEDVRRMRQEFFTLSPRDSLTRSPSPPRMLLPHSRTLSTSNQPFSTSYETDPDGTVRFVANFDVAGFEPSQMKVSVKNGELLVSARTERRVGGSATTREYTRSVKLPAGADDRLAAATLTSDGILTFSCPIQKHLRSRSSPRRLDSDVHSTETRDSFSPLSDSHGSGENASAQVGDRIRARNIESSYRNVYTSPSSGGMSLGTPSSSSTSVLTGSIGTRPKFRLELPIESDYSPSEIQIRTLNRRIYINARHEERGANRTAVREFSKEYDIPDNVDPECLEARFENGMLYIEATAK